VKEQLDFLRTDNPVLPLPFDLTTATDCDASHPLTALILSCQSLVFKKKSLQNIINNTHSFLVLSHG